MPRSSTRGTSHGATGGRSARQTEQLLILSLAIVFAIAGFLFHVFWIAAIITMALLWGYMASEVGGSRRSGGVASDLVTSISDEARELSHEVSGGTSRRMNPEPHERPTGSATASGDATKEELYEEAREVGIEGRSSMSKEELRRALDD